MNAIKPNHHLISVAFLPEFLLRLPIYIKPGITELFIVIRYRAIGRHVEVFRRNDDAPRRKMVQAAEAVFAGLKGPSALAQIQAADVLVLRFPAPVPRPGIPTAHAFRTAAFDGHLI